MAGKFPFATEALTTLSIVKKNGDSFDIIPWSRGSSNPLISLSFTENMFSPLMTGTMVIRDAGEWLKINKVFPNDEIHFTLNATVVNGRLNKDRNDSTIKNYNLEFEITNVKNTVTLASDEFQNETENIKALTIEFISKSILNKEFLSSILETENFIGPIYADASDTFSLNGTESPTVELKGFNSYIKDKFDIEIDGDKTWNYCYLKKNNISYPWGKVRGQPTIIQTLQYLAENAVNYANNSAVNYLFWEDLDGYHFKCIDTLIKNSGDAEDKTFVIGDNQFSPSNIHAFETISEFDNLQLLNSNVYYSWYERIIPNYADPYLDFVDTSSGLTRQNIIFDIKDEYDKISHVESKSIIPENFTDNLERTLSQSHRTDDDVYGFYSKNRYNTPFAQSWDYLGLSADTRLSNVVWQNQFDIDDEVYPEILYGYDRLVKNKQIANREKYTKLKNAKKKWEVYRCSVCCTDQLGGTADQAILKNLSSESPDYQYYFGQNGIFKEFSDDYKVVAAGSFSDVVNFDSGITFNNGLTLSYDMNSYPYNQTISQFYNIKSTFESANQIINDNIQKYQTELNEINILIPRIQDFLSKVDGWITSAADLAFTNLSPLPKKNCPRYSEFGYLAEQEIPIEPGNGCACACCLDTTKSGMHYYCTNYYGIVAEEQAGSASLSFTEVDATLAYNNRYQDDVRREMFFGSTTCGADSLVQYPLYVNLQYKTQEDVPEEFSGSWGFLVDPVYENKFKWPIYLTKLGCKSLVDGLMAWELPYQQPGFLYECTKSKLLTGLYVSNDVNYTSAANVLQPSDFSDQQLNDDVDNNKLFCATCLDFIQLEAAKYEYRKVLKEKQLRVYILTTLIEKLTSLLAINQARYEEFLNRKAFFISKNPFDRGVTGNILNKKSDLSLFNIKSVKRKPIRGSRYEVLANKIGITSGVGQYIYNIYFDDDAQRKPGITGNHPYYDQKFKGFSFGAYASKPGFKLSKFDGQDIAYYDNELSRFEGVPGFADGNTQNILKPFEPIKGYFLIPESQFSYDTPVTLDSDFSLESQLGDLSLLTNKYNIFNENSQLIPSIEKEKISSYVRIEFLNPIGLNSLADFPNGFIRDAGSEYFLPYLVQLTAGPNGRQTIQSNAVVIGIDPYGFDIAVKKNKTKNNYSDFKEWGNYWWFTPLNKLRIENKTKDIPEMSLWAEPAFENEKTYYQNNGEYYFNIGEDYTEYDNYCGIIGSILTDFRFTEYSSSLTDEQLYFTDYYNTNGPTVYSTFYTRPYGIVNPNVFGTAIAYFNISSALDFYKFNSTYVLPFTEKITNKLIVLPKQKEKNNNFKYGSYNLLSSHLHYNTRRSWYDFNYQNKSYLDTIISSIGNINGVMYSANINYYLNGSIYGEQAFFNDTFQSDYNFVTPTLFKVPDIYAYGGNDFINTFSNSVKLKNSSTLTSILNQTENTNLRADDLFTIPGMDLLKQLSENLSIFSDEIEAQLNGNLLLYRPGLVSSDVWKYDLFGESEYGLTSPPTLPPEYDLFDNNFAAQFVVFGRSSTSNVCRDLNLKCLNPQGKVDNSDCPENDPYCKCPAKNLMPKEAEPSYKELAIAYNDTKECTLIEKSLGTDYLGCMLSDPENVTSCNCPNQGKYYPTFLNTIRSNATFYVTPPKTPLRRQAQMSLITAQQAVMTIFPNDSIKIGDIINVFRGIALDGKDTINGKWMVTGITRLFKSAATELMILNINRDSMKE